MLYFFPHEHCQECEEIGRQLKQLVLAHRVILPGQTHPNAPPIPKDLTPPVLIDGKNIIKGISPILAHLETLRKFKEEWDKFQSDSCYCGDDGEIE